MKETGKGKSSVQIKMTCLFFGKRNSMKITILKGFISLTTLLNFYEGDIYFSPLQLKIVLHP